MDEDAIAAQKAKDAALVARARDDIATARDHLAGGRALDAIAVILVGGAELALEAVETELDL